MQIKKKISLISSFIILFSCCSTSHANFLQMDNWRPFLTLTGGAAFSSDLGDSQTLPIIDSSTYTYSPDDSNVTRFLWGGFLGVELPFYPETALQLGLAYDQVDFSINGDLSQGADARSTDIWRYKYIVLYRQLLLEAKLLFNWCDIYHPYVVAGAGASFNEAKNYSTNVPPFLTFTPEFSNHSNTSFSYSVGVGVDVDLSHCLRLGVGYRFSDYGKVRLSDGLIDTVFTGSHLSQSHSYVNEVVAQLTFLMN